MYTPKHPSCIHKSELKVGIHVTEMVSRCPIVKGKVQVNNYQEKA